MLIYYLLLLEDNFKQNSIKTISAHKIGYRKLCDKIFWNYNAINASIICNIYCRRTKSSF